MLAFKRSFCCLLLLLGWASIASAQSKPPVIGYYVETETWSDPLEALARMLHRVGQQHPNARFGGDDAAQSWKLAIY